MNSKDNIVGRIDKMASAHSYAWTINNVCVCCSRKLVISPEFRTGLNNENIWVLEKSVDSDAIYVRVKLKDTIENTAVEVAYVLSILTTENRISDEMKVQKTFKKYEFSHYVKMIDTESLKTSPCKYIPNKQLTILCEIEDLPVRKVTKHTHEKLVDNLQKLFEDPKHTDAKIVVGEKTFDVHKAILVSRSSWFKAAFEGGMQEQQRNEVSVTNYEYEVVKEVLRYIYTGQVKSVENFVDRLLDAAIYFQLDELKTICLEILSDNLSLENLHQVLHLADIHRIHDLKKNVLDFMSLHTNELIDVEMKCTSACKQFEVTQ